MNVFNDCDVLGPTPVPLDDIPANFQVDSSIDKPGGVRVAFFGIVYGPAARQVDVGVQLIGDCFNTNGCNDDFIPDPAVDTGHGMGISEFILSHALLQGHTLKEIRPKGHCNKDGHTVDLDSTTTLFQANASNPVVTTKIGCATKKAPRYPPSVAREAKSGNKTNCAFWKP